MNDTLTGSSLPQSISTLVGKGSAGAAPVSRLPDASGALLAASRSPDVNSEVTTAEWEEMYYSSDDDEMSFSSTIPPSVQEPSRHELIPSWFPGSSCC